MNYSHSGDLGDIVAFLPNMKRKPGNLFIKASSFTRRSLTPARYATLTPLLMAQDYVKWVGPWKGEEIDYDGDTWRKNYVPDYDLVTQQVPFMVEEPWLTVEPKGIASVIINRTLRYRNLEDYKDLDLRDAIFIGLPNEYFDFQKRHRHIGYYKTTDLLEAARVIAGADRFVGNQSCCFWIAEALRKPITLEVWPEDSNCCRPREGVNYV